MSTIGASAAPSSYMVQQRTSTWHSPVPYLFGGLAAMLGIIAFALFILACSYWKLSGQFDNHRGDSGEDLEAGQSDGGLKVAQPVMEETLLVIMAGHDRDKPTFLATPITSRASSFGSNSTTTCSTSCSGSGTLSMEPSYEEKKREIGGQTEMGDVNAH